MNNKKRIDVLLVEKGFFSTREKAKRIVMEGLVFVGENRIDKPGEKIDIDSEIVVKGDPIPYVSRGGLKLEKAIKKFNIELGGKTAIDIGASTGGFTDCMLKEGIKKVCAIDVGYGQLDWNLRNDDRVVVKERTNIRYVNKDDIGDRVDFISIDVSFISLKLVLPVAEKLLKDEGEIVALIKPQFEAGREKVGKKGLVKDKKVHFEVVKKIINICDENKLRIDNVTYSPITGATGNIEFLAHIVKKANQIDILDDFQIKQIIEDAHKSL